MVEFSGQRILIIEDDRDIADGVCRILGNAGLGSEIAGSLAQAEQALAKGGFDMVIVDLTLPDGDGLALTRWLKEHTQLGILILSARGETTERIVGLEVGADDFLPKPFEPRELLARVRALLRRLGGAHRPWPGTDSASAAAQASAGGAVYRFEGLTLDVARRVLADSAGAEIALTAAEFNLLLALVERPGHVLSREQLMERAQGGNPAAFDRSIDVLIGRVRKKIVAAVGQAGVIKTVRNAGYTLSARVERT